MARQPRDPTTERLLAFFEKLVLALVAALVACATVHMITGR